MDCRIKVKFIPLIWSGIRRNRGRAVLLFLQIIVTFILFGLLHGMNGALKQALEKQRADVLYVNARVQDAPLPLAYLEKIAAVPGVQIANPQNFLLGEYQNPAQPIVAVATNPQRYFDINTYLSVPE